MENHIKELGERLDSCIRQMVTHYTENKTKELMREVLTFELKDSSNKTQWAQVQAKITTNPLYFLDEEATYRGHVPEELLKQIVNDVYTTIETVLNYCEEKRIRPQDAEEICMCIEDLMHNVLSKLTTREKQ